MWLKIKTLIELSLSFLCLVVGGVDDCNVKYKFINEFKLVFYECVINL